MDAVRMWFAHTRDAEPSAIRAMQAMLDERMAAIEGLSYRQAEIACLENERAILLAERARLLLRLKRSEAERRFECWAFTVLAIGYSLVLWAVAAR